MAIANNLLQVQQCHEEVQTDRWIPASECRGKSRYVVPPQSWERPVPQQMGGRSRGREFQLNLQGWGKFVLQGLRMGVFWAEGAAGGKAQR